MIVVPPPTVAMRLMLASIQCLRGVAALMVVILHVVLFSQGATEGSESGLIILGNAGVDMPIAAMDAVVVDLDFAISL